MKIKTIDFNKIWINSYAHERANHLRSIGINDDQLIVKLVNTPYVELNAEIRYKFEVIDQ